MFGVYKNCQKFKLVWYSSNLLFWFLLTRQLVGDPTAFTQFVTEISFWGMWPVLLCGGLQGSTNFMDFVPYWWMVPSMRSVFEGMRSVFLCGVSGVYLVCGIWGLFCFFLWVVLVCGGLWGWLGMWPQKTPNPTLHCGIWGLFWVLLRGVLVCGGAPGLAPGWLPSPPTGKVAPLVKSNYRLTDEFSAALPLNSLKPLKRSLDHLICLAPGEVVAPF